MCGRFVDCAVGDPAKVEPAVEVKTRKAQPKPRILLIANPNALGAIGVSSNPLAL